MIYEKFQKICDKREDCLNPNACQLYEYCHYHIVVDVALGSEEHYIKIITAMRKEKLEKLLK